MKRSAAALAVVVSGAVAACTAWPHLSLKIVQRRLAQMPVTVAPIELRGPGQNEPGNSVQTEAVRTAADYLAASERRLGTTAKFWCAKGQLFLLEGREEDAVRLFQLARVRYPSELCTVFGAGLAFASRAARDRRASDYPAAAEAFLEAEAKGYRSPELFYNLAVILERLAAPHSALHFWRRAEERERAAVWRARIQEGVTRCQRRVEGRTRAVAATLAGDNPTRLPPGGLDLLQTQAVAAWLPDQAHFSDKLQVLARVLRESRDDRWLANLLRGVVPPLAAAALGRAAVENRAGRHEEALRAAEEAHAIFKRVHNEAGTFAAALELALARSRTSGAAPCLAALTGVRGRSEQRSYRWLQWRAWLQEINCRTQSRRVEIWQERMLAARMSPAWGYDGLALRAQAVLADPFRSFATPSEAWSNGQRLLEQYWLGVYPEPAAVTYYVSLALSADTAGLPRVAAYVLQEAVATMDGHPNRTLRAELWADLADVELKKEQYGAAATYYDRSARELDVGERALRTRALAMVAHAAANLEAGRTDAALKWITDLAAMESFPYPGFNYYERLRLLPAMGNVLLALGRKGDALRHLQAAVAECIARMEAVHDPVQRQVLLRESEDAWRGLVKAQLKTGDITGALETWQVFRGGRARHRGAMIFPEGSLWLSYAAWRDRVSLWAADSSGVEQYWIHTAELQAKNERLLAALSDPHTALDEIQALSGELARALLPADRRMARVRTLVIDADGWVAAVPWPLLPDASGQPIVERHAIVQSHGWRETADRLNRAAAPLQPALLVADPALNRDTERSFPPLADARTEAASLSARLRNVTVLTGPEAHVDAVRRLIPNYRVFHFAGHGISDGGLGALMMARRGDSGDNLFTAQHVADLDLSQVQSVVLSACSSGVGEMSGVLDLGSIVRAFLEAGAGTVVSARWNIASRPVAAMMQVYYSELMNGTSAAEALRRAAVAVRKRPQTAHPYYWAAFQVYGGGLRLDENRRR